MIFGRVRESLLPRKFPAIRYMICNVYIIVVNTESNMSHYEVEDGVVLTYSGEEKILL